MQLRPLVLLAFTLLLASCEGEGKAKECVVSPPSCGCTDVCVTKKEARKIARGPICDIGCPDTGINADLGECMLVDDECQFVKDE